MNVLPGSTKFNDREGRLAAVTFSAFLVVVVIHWSRSFRNDECGGAGSILLSQCIIWFLLGQNRAHLR
jgi:hypothetical protein